MIIAIPYENGQVFQHFGKAEQFKIYKLSDEEILSAELVDTNGTGHGALAQFLSDRQVNAIICGGIGAGAVNALSEAGIQIMGGASGEADKQVMDFLNGKLHFESSASCQHSHSEGEGCKTCGQTCNGEEDEQECDGNISACGQSCR